MAPPPTKKVKIELDLSTPIIFTAPDQRPDVGLRVFNQQFEVYSGVLKIHSGFFRKFLDSSGGVLPTSTSPSLTSEWFTKVDADGKSWSLTSDSKFRDADTSKFSGPSMVEQEEAFRKLLCAIFSRPYDIKNIHELLIMTKHADYYFCLPILSHSLSGPLYNSPGLVPTIGNAPCETLEAAYRLRHKQLFNDSFIRVMGPWNNPRYKQLKEPKLLRIAKAAHANMCDKLLKIHEGMLEIFADADDCFKDTGKVMVALAKEALDKDSNIIQPKYYRLCYDHDYKSFEGGQAVRKLLGPVLKNNLALNKG